MAPADAFDADVTGRDFARGEPDPTIFLAAVAELGLDPGACVVIEDAPAGIRAARAGGMAALAVSREHDAGMLREAGADLVVSSLDEVAVEALPSGRLQTAREGRVGMSVWSLEYDGFDPEQQGLREALCTLGNGYFATRGAAPESRVDGVNYPGTYVAGLYNRLSSTVAGRTVENEDLVNAPNWLPLDLRLEEGPWFDARQAELLSYRQELDLRSGLLLRHLRWRDGEGRVTRVDQHRFVHMDKPHLAAMKTVFVAENWSGTLQVRSGLDGGVSNAGVRRYRSLANRHLDVLAAEAVDGEVVELEVQTTQSHVRVAEAARTRVARAGRPAPVRREASVDGGFVAHVLAADLRQEEPLTVEKIVALYTSRDHAISEPRSEARTAVQRAGGFDQLLIGHTRAWDHLWSRYGISIAGGDTRPQLALNLHIFHLLQTVSPNTIDLDVGVPARGLHGEAYRGHIFWDALFIFPFLNFESPTLTRSLLAYRHRRLDEARWLARDDGHEGACYPWQSGSNGREETQRVHLNPRSGRWLPDNSHLQRHVSIAIAFDVWQHYQVTGSIEFLRFMGAEMLVEIARFLTSLSSYNPALDRYEIRGVMGPDEYHDGYPDSDRPGLDNNAYTNVMTVWVLLRALEALQLLPAHYRQEVAGELGLADIELERWRDISRKMHVPFHQDGVISQFEGYEQLEELDWEAYRRKYGDIQRLDRILEAEGDSTNRYKVSKQADVLMLLYLLYDEELLELLERLGYQLDEDVLPRTIAYYLARTSHGSTLSGVVHALVLARCERERAWEFLLQALESDVSDVQGGTTAEGVHLGAMAGTVDIVQRAFSGMEARGDVLWFKPSLPAELTELSFSVHYRGHRVDVTIARERFRVATRPGPGRPIKLGLDDKMIDLEPGGTVELELEATP
jgi:trehalose/maltose hydrolase-like predicted phosphorylase